MEVIAANGIKVYNVSTGKAAPQWLQEKRKKEKAYLKKGGEKVQLELIQEFMFPTTATKLRKTNDGQLILAAGVYPPMVKAFSTEDLSMKFKRHLDADVVTFDVLTDDFSKMVFLRADRTFEFHGKAGIYYKTRMPIFGRDMVYHYPTCDLIAVGGSNLIYRLNLEQGRFLKPLSGSSPAFNVCTLNPASGIMAVGGVDGIMECWDPRDRSNLAILRLGNSKFDSFFNWSSSSNDEFNPPFDNSDNFQQSGISSLKFSNDGISIAAGMASGHVLIYDLRSSIPVVEKDHQFDTPITDIHFHESSRNVISSCRKIIRIWDKDTGKSFCNVEPSFDINTILPFGDSGMLFVGGENPRMNAYYIPELGPAPKWASFLDNITEELEASEKQEIYQDFKFVTKEDLERLGVVRLIGTPYLKAYMHGFFIDFRLYKKIQDVARPDEYRSYLKQRVQEQMEKKRGSRISAIPAVKLSSKVNQEYLQQIYDKKGSNAASSAMNDPRFGRMFSDPSMAVDTSSAAYLRTKPMQSFSDKLASEFNAVPSKNNKTNDIGFDEDPDDHERDNQADAYGFTNEDYGDDDTDDITNNGDGKSSSKNKNNPKKRSRSSSDPISSLLQQHNNQHQTSNRTPRKNDKNEDDEGDSLPVPSAKKMKGRQHHLMEATDDHDSPFQMDDKKKIRQTVSFQQRLASSERKKINNTTDHRAAVLGPLQMTFTLGGAKKEENEERYVREARKERNKDRRSMKRIQPKAFNIHSKHPANNYRQ